MNDVRWRRVEELFAAAVDLDDEPRRALLRRECAGDDELLREVEELLAAEHSGVDLISEVVEGAAAQLVDADNALAAAHLLGPWRVAERLGEGGTSVVYRATRDDDQFSKQVALKVLKRGMDTDDILRRFSTEKQILARLDHPNIARLLDAGTTPDGRPYFVMELVDGAPIDVYCDRLRLSIEERLRLFRQICAAVTYAHRNLVVHRDLKPSNILVNADGVPKLLDFGIAKLLDSESHPQSLEITAAPFRLLTLGYASPEQIAGKAVTTASDLYSLGVVLYQLLCGLRPYRLTDRSPRDVERLVREQEPRRPSAAVRAPQDPSGADGVRLEEVAAARGLTVDDLARRLWGDLDAVVLRALRKRPEDRYSSVERLVDDLDRHQNHLPVQARHGSFRYQAGRFLRRHRWSVALASIAALVLVVFVTTLIVQRLRLEEEREASERRWHLAEEVKEFLIDLFPMTDADGANMTARELLDRGAEIAMHENHPPEIRAARLDTVGRVYQRLGLYRQATPLLEKSLELARQGAGHESPEHAASLNRLAILWVQQGDFERAKPLFRETLELRQRLFGPRHPVIAASLNNLALLLHDMGDYASAEPLYRQAVQMDTDLEGGEALSTLSDKANLGLLLYDLGRYDESELLLREALVGREKELGADHAEIADPLTHLAMVLTARGQFAEAEPILRRAFRITEETVSGDHPQIARILSPLAELERRRGALDAAEELYRRALAIRQVRLGEDHPELATNLVNLADTLLDANRPEHAEAILERVIELYRSTGRDSHPDAARAFTAMARLRVETGHASVAAPLLGEASAILRPRLPAGHRRLRALEVLAARLAEPEPTISD